MPLYRHITFMSCHTHMYISIGSGMTNAAFVNSNPSESRWSSYILHISPYNVFGASGAFSQFISQGTTYRDWTNPFIENTV